MTDYHEPACRYGARFVIIDALAPNAPVFPSAGAAFWIVLEKFGFLDYRLASLDEAWAIESDLPFILIVPNAIVRRLSASDLARLSQLGAPSFIEGPYDDHLGKLLGVCISRKTGRTAQLEVRDNALERAMLAGLSDMATPSNSGAFRDLGSLAISPRKQRQRAQSGVPSSFCTVNKGASEALYWAVRQARTVPGAGRRDLVVARAQAGDEAFPLLFQSGIFLVSTFEMLTYIMEDYSSPYLDDTYEFSNDRYPIEFMLIWLLRQLIATEGGSQAAKAALAARIAPWPRGAQVALAVRHDVDRIPAAVDTERLLAAEAQAGVGVTSFFLGRTARDDLVRAFEKNGAEIAYHSEYLEPSGAQERAAIEEASGAPVVGSSVHGNAGFYGWRGVANWEIYREMGFAYAEQLSSMRYLPSRMFRFDSDGSSVVYPFVGLPHHFSFERNKVEQFRRHLASAMQGLERNEVCLIVLNHPDLHVDEFIAFLYEDVPAHRADMTIKGIAEWWKKTHFRENLCYQLISAKDYLLELALESAQPIAALTLEIPGYMELEGISIIPNQTEELPESSLRHGVRRACNALTGKCTRIWFDLPGGRHRIVLRLAPESEACTRYAALLK